MNLMCNCGKFIVYLFLFVNLFDVNICVKLRGVTLPNWPYVERYTDNSGATVYDGFGIELIDKISKYSGFDFELYDVPDGQYGVYDRETGTYNGMIGELIANKADFAIGDLTITEERQAYVNFTNPFMTSGIAALIHTRYANRIQTFSDLYYQTELSYGVIAGSATQSYFYYSKDAIIRKMYEYMDQNRDVYVNSRSEGISRVNSSAYAFISESASLEYSANEDCDLMVVYDKNNEFRDFRREYAIAMRKNSRYLNGFNFALENLNKSGELEELRLRYWSNECETDSDDSYETAYSYALLPQIPLIVLLIFSLFFKSMTFLR